MKEKQFVLGVDLDGICCDFLGACAFLEEKLEHRNLWPVLRSAVNPEWLEEVLAGYQYDRSLYSALNPIPYAASSLCALDTEIVYITARPMFAKQDTLLWLERHSFPHGKVINVRGDSKVAAAKREKVDVFIEDRTMYANPLAAAGIKVILLDVYDRDLGAMNWEDGVTVVRSWRECRAAIREVRRYE